MAKDVDASEETFGAPAVASVAYQGLRGGVG